MADQLIVELLDNEWQRLGITVDAVQASITDELGQVGEASVEIPVTDAVRQYLPNPDADEPWEGRFRIMEDNTVVFAGVIDNHSIKMDSNDATVSFNGKHRGVELGYYNLGRVDYLGWNIREMLRELTRDNIARLTTLEDNSHADDENQELYPPYQMVTGDPFKQNYWYAVGLPAYATFDMGSQTTINAIRVMPQWWKDIDTGKFHYHQFKVWVSDDNTNWTLYAQKGNTLASSAKGHLFSGTNTCRYVKLEVTGSTDGSARIAQLMIYQNRASIGADTTYTVPFIENDDSGNVTATGAVTRPVTPGAFQGDSVITRSYTTRLSGSGQKITQKFRGVSSAVFFTSHNNGAGVADIYVDGAFRQQISIPNNRYWFKGYDTVEDFGGALSDTAHTLEVRWVSGIVQVDYFNGLYQTSWRPIEDDDPALAYRGNWYQVEGAGYHNFFASVSEAAENDLYFEFTGDRVRIIGTEGIGYGSFVVRIDGSIQTTVDTSETSTFHKRNLYEWTGSYGDHNIRITTTSAAKVVIDRIEGNFSHTLYMRSRYETNLKVLIRMSEIIDSYVRFNNDGSIDLLGNLGDDSETALIEGTNEGGTMISADVETDYSETGSAVLAIVNVNGELPIKAFVVDKEAVSEIGYKVIKLEQSDAADQFLLNRQALQYLREKRKPNRSYSVTYDPDEVGNIGVGQTTRLYSPTSNLAGDSYRVGRITTDYVKG